MFAKIAVIACVLAVANAGDLLGGAYGSYAAPAIASYAAPAAYASYAAPAAYASYSAPALTATSNNVYRSAGNLQSISTYSKSIATPFSSSNKHDVRITNPGVYAHATPVAYAAPVAHATYAAPAVAAPLAYSAPVAHAAPAIAHGSSLLGVAYSPAVAVSHMSYSSPVGINYSW